MRLYLPPASPAGCLGLSVALAHSARVAPGPPSGRPGRIKSVPLGEQGLKGVGRGRTPVSRSHQPQLGPQSVPTPYTVGRGESVGSTGRFPCIPIWAPVPFQPFQLSRSVCPHPPVVEPLLGSRTEDWLRVSRVGGLSGAGGAVGWPGRLPSQFCGLLAHA